MNSLVVEELLNLLRDLHVLGQISATNMRRGNDSIARQLPHVELVHCQHSVHFLKEASLDRIDLEEIIK